MVGGGGRGEGEGRRGSVMSLGPKVVGREMVAGVMVVEGVGGKVGGLTGPSPGIFFFFFFFLLISFLVFSFFFLFFLNC